MTTPVCYSGGCACGAIRYRCSAEPVMAFNCHCRDCQRASGSAFASILVVPTTAFEILTGEPAYHSVVADSGHTMQRGFCAQCGSPLLIREPARPGIVLVQAGGLDDPGRHQPAADIFQARAHPWDYMNPDLPGYPTMPPLPDSPLFRTQH